MDRNEIIELWLRQISESFAEVNQFQNSDNYELFANWEESVWELLEEHDELSIEMIEGKVAEVNSILIDARDEITWVGGGINSFDKHMDTLVYPEAWKWWNRKRYDIQTDLFTSCKERNFNGVDIFSFEINEDQPTHTLSIPLTRLSVDPGALSLIHI